MSSTTITRKVGDITFSVTEDEPWTAKQAYERMLEWAIAEAER